MSLYKMAGFVALGAVCVGCGGETPNDDGDRWPREAVSILVDDRGVPHIFAKSDEDALFASGYQMASDRMFSISMLRRLLTGRLAEVLGVELLKRDQQLRIFDLSKLAAADRAATEAEEPELATLIAAWVEGVNRRIDEVSSGAVEVPYGFAEQGFLPERWSHDDVYVILKGAELGLGRSAEFEIAITMLTRTFPEAMGAVDLLKPARPAYGLPPEHRPLPIGDDAGEDRSAGAASSAAYRARVAEMSAAMSSFVRAFPKPGASNNWAVAGEHTDTGRPLLAGDPHLAMDLMGAMYPMHINSADAGGSLDVAGFAFPGIPGIALGHTRDVAWTQTTAFGDVMDVWEVAVDGTTVTIGDAGVALDERREVFLVRDGGDVGQGYEEELVYRDVDGYGTIIPDELLPFPVGGPFMLNWMGFNARPPRWPLALNRMKDLSDFEAAVDSMPELNQSCIAADQDEIGYALGIEVPLREDVSGDRRPYMAMRGDDAGSYWTGETVPLDLLPHVRNPERGWLGTGNNDPFGFTDDGRVDNDPFYYGAFFAPGWRASRVYSELERMTDAGSVSLDDMKALQMDTHSLMADDLVPMLVEALNNVASDPDLGEFVGNTDMQTVATLLAEWDRRMTRDSAAALAFQAFAHFTTAGVVRDDISIAYDFAVELKAGYVMKLAINALRGEFADGDTILQEGRDYILLAALRETAGWLTERFGGVDPSLYAFGDLKRTSFDHALGQGTLLGGEATDGGEDTVNVSQNIVFWEADMWEANMVSAERSVITFTQDGTPEAWVNYPFAAHGSVDSDVQATTMHDYVEGGYHKLLYERDEIDAATVETIELLPR